MNLPAQPVDVRQFLTGHLIEVVDTMLSRQAAPVANAALPHNAERVTGSVGFAGESVNGVVYLHLTAPFARSGAAAILGLAPEEIGEADENDAIGELTNMLAGGLKSALCDAGATCAVSTPGIIRGNSYSIEPTPDLERIWLGFECGVDHVVVEVHIKYNN
jgi:CheY-specific phosphatase CheX